LLVCSSFSNKILAQVYDTDSLNLSKNESLYEFNLKNGLRVYYLKNDNYDNLDIVFHFKKPNINYASRVGVHKVFNPILYLGYGNILLGRMNSCRSLEDRIIFQVDTAKLDSLLSVLPVFFTPNRIQSKTMRIQTETVLRDYLYRRVYPEDMADGLAARVFYPDSHPYSGEESYQSISLFDNHIINRIADDYCVPNNSMFFIRSNKELEYIQTKLKENIESWLPVYNKDNRKQYKIPEIKKPIYKHINTDDSLKNFTRLLWTIDYNRNDPDYDKIFLAKILLTDITNNILGQELEASRSDCFKYSSELRSELNGTELKINFYTIKDKLEDIISNSKKAIDRIIDMDYDISELEESKEILKKHYNKKKKYEKIFFCYDNDISVNTYYNKSNNIDGISKKQISDILKKYLAVENYLLVQIGNSKLIKEEMNKLNKNEFIDEYDIDFNAVVLDYKDYGFDDYNVKKVVKKYVDAIGGYEQIKGVDSLLTIEWEGSLSGASFNEVYRTKNRSNTTKYYEDEKLESIITYRNAAYVLYGPENNKFIKSSKKYDYLTRARLFPIANLPKSKYRTYYQGIDNFRHYICNNIRQDIIRRKYYSLAFEYFFDIKTGLLVGKEMIINDRPTTYYYQNYEDYGGIKMPSFYFEQYYKSYKTYSVDAVEINPELPKKIFRLKWVPDYYSTDEEFMKEQEEIDFLEAEKARKEKEAAEAKAKAKAGMGQNQKVPSKLIEQQK
jgi:predicted Zn-dependent peptidase